MIISVVTAVLLMVGALLVLIAAIGLRRFDGVLPRMHASSKAVTLGLLLIFAGTALQMRGSAATTKLVLVAVLQLITAPIAAHLVGRAAYRNGELTRQTRTDELARDIRREQTPPHP